MGSLKKKSGRPLPKKKGQAGIPSKKRIVIFKGRRYLYDVDTKGQKHLYLLDKK